MLVEEPGVHISLTAIYEKVIAVEKSLETVQAQLGPHISITKDKQDEYEGRLENHGTRLANLDSRLTVIETKTGPRAPWYSIVGGVASGLAGVGTLVTLLIFISRLPPL